MDKKEQDIQNMIVEKTKDIEVPEELAPEAVARKIKEMEQDGKKQQKLTRSRKMMAAAAMFILVIGAAAAVKQLSPQPDVLLTGESEDAKEKKQQGLTVAKNYGELYSYVKQVKVKEITEAQIEDATVYSGTTESAPSGEMNAGASAKQSAAADQAAGGYSKTNVRQEGVDEADIVKTDGTYLYSLKDNREEIAVIDPVGGEMKSCGTIKADEGFIEEFYLNTTEKKLIIISSISGSNGNVMPLARGGYGGEQTTKAITFDISDPQNPKEAGQITQSGSYHSSRMNGGYLYLFSLYFVSNDISKSEKETYVPSVGEHVLPAESIYLPTQDSANMYTVITAVNVNNPKEVSNSKAVLSKNSELYVSNENIYLYEAANWGAHNMTTNICKIAYQDGTLTPIGQGQADGYIQDSFSIDEYKGNLRLVTTEGDTNSVYVLDKNLQLIGSITNLAKDERVYSARLMGDIGYFVTFRETDPLFSVNFSDPANPQILGALKIPGFSEYLHPYGENQLLGVGMDVDEKTSATNGVKLSMFDAADKIDVKQAHTYVLENVYSADVLYDYKAAMIDSEKNLIGFAAYTEGGQKYYLFSYDKENGFQSLMEQEINGSTLISPRGIYIGNVLYVAAGNIIESYSLETYQKMGDIIL